MKTIPLSEVKPTKIYWIDFYSKFGDLGQTYKAYSGRELLKSYLPRIPPSYYSLKEVTGI